MWLEGLILEFMVGGQGWRCYKRPYLESLAKELKFLSEFLHGAQAEEGPSASSLT